MAIENISTSLQERYLNYRGITILSTVIKVYERILKKILKCTIKHQLEESQS